ncbi:melanocyte-stimulating hormone receptor-like [Pocillopora verrucosa]|uniref:melanocyte-stimulating hormone receptor-like n=1 Tax=Pocillopora verrucosa TaxID=203993 RepID=UPI00333F5B88
MQNYSITNFTRGGTKTKTFDEQQCSLSLIDGLQSASVFFAAVNIFLAVTTFLGNSLILVALHKESSLHPPSKLLYRCLATTDLLVGLVAQPLHVTYLMSVVHEHWSLCHYAREAADITGVTLCGVSLLTMAVISVDRLLALLLGLRYKEIVTLKRIYIIIASFWVLCLVASLCTIFDQRITLLSILISIPLSLLISLASYTKIFRTLRNHQAQVQQQPSQPNALNMARYRKAVYRALWVQSVLVICYTPYLIVIFVITSSTTSSSNSAVAWQMAIILVFFNSTLNPFLYCWKISEVRRAMKQTIRQALCCPWS